MAQLTNRYDFASRNWHVWYIGWRPKPEELDLLRLQSQKGRLASRHGTWDSWDSWDTKILKNELVVSACFSHNSGIEICSDDL